MSLAWSRKRSSASRLDADADSWNCGLWKPHAGPLDQCQSFPPLRSSRPSIQPSRRSLTSLSLSNSRINQKSKDIVVVAFSTITVSAHSLREGITKRWESSTGESQHSLCAEQREVFGQLFSRDNSFAGLHATLDHRVFRTLDSTSKCGPLPPSLFRKRIGPSDSSSPYASPNCTFSTTLLRHLSTPQMFFS